MLLILTDFNNFLETFFNFNIFISLPRTKPIKVWKFGFIAFDECATFSTRNVQLFYKWSFLNFVNVIYATISVIPCDFDWGYTNSGIIK
jgi:hypothetical protein